MRFALLAPAVLLAFGQANVRAEIDCGDAQSQVLFEQCVREKAPLCGGYTQRQFQIKCCETGVPIPEKAGCALKPSQYINCGTAASPDLFQGCVHAYAPLCQGMTAEQFANGCCPQGHPNKTQAGCDFVQTFF